LPVANRENVQICGQIFALATSRRSFHERTGIMLAILNSFFYINFNKAIFANPLNIFKIAVDT